MEGRVAQGRASTGIPKSDPHWLDLLPSALIGAGLVAAALAAYWLPGSVRIYNHFVWQAAAFLDGQAAIPWPVPGNNFQDFFPLTDAAGHPTGFGLLPFPPLPAIVLMPFVALWGLATDERAVSVVVGAIDVGLCWWMLGRLPVGRMVRLAVTIFFGFGTVAWYAAGLGTTWFFAHVVALAPLFAGVGLALGGDRSFAADTEPEPEPESGPEPGPGVPGDPARGERPDDVPVEPPLAVAILDALRAAAAEVAVGLRAPFAFVDPRQFAAGLLFGIACTARLTIVFGAPFFMFVGSGGSLARRSISAGLGAIIPVGLLLAYNLVTTGQLFHPGYEYLYRLEAIGYPSLGYNPDWAIEDIRYLPQNLGIMFLSTPAIFPDRMPSGLGPGDLLCTAQGAVRGLFDPACPIALPVDTGMSLILTSPAYLFVLPTLARFRRSRLVAGATLAVASIAFVNLMHFSQGWVQFGYRFSNDFVVFALPLVALGMARRGGVGLLAGWLVGASVAVNFWGMTWGNLRGW